MVEPLLFCILSLKTQLCSEKLGVFPALFGGFSRVNNTTAKQRLGCFLFNTSLPSA